MISDLKESLAHILWIGGSPCAGKTSISNILGEKYNLFIYHCDEYYKEHVKRCNPVQQPIMSKLAPMPEDEFWMRPVEQQVIEEVAFCEEEFSMVIDDLLKLSKDRAIIVEGTLLLPKLVTRVLKSLRSAIWVIPTEEFQRKYYPNRGSWVNEILKQCRDPKQAFENWMQRDIKFAKLVEEQCVEQKLYFFRVDGTKTIADNTKIIEKWFGLC